MNEQPSSSSVFQHPRTGTVLAVASGVSFFVLSMMLPLVGPAGSRVEHAGKNEAVFVLMLLLTLILAGLAGWSKMGRRRLEGGPLPWFSFILCGMCVVTAVILLFDGFAI